MSFGGRTPAVPESTYVEDKTAAEKAAQEAADRERKAALLRRGRASTILAGNETLSDPFTKKSTLLGG